MEKVLTAVCRECRNYFVRTIERGTFTISGGVITVQGAYLPRQHIRLMGSVLNDGVYLVEDSLITLTEAQSETFTGIVCGLAIPADFLELVAEITTYRERAESNPNLGFVKSETFPNYSYTAATDENGNVANWKSVFQSRLNPYRKMFDEVVL